MEKNIQKLHALFVFFALNIPVYCNADTIGFDNSTFAAPTPVTSPVANSPTQNNPVISNPTPTNRDNASTADSGTTTPNAHTLAAVGYHSLRQHLATQAPIVLAQNTEVGDCIDSTGGVKSGSGNYSEESACPSGYIPYAIQTTKTPTDSNWLRQFIKVHGGTVYYLLRCCKARVAYS